MSDPAYKQRAIRRTAPAAGWLGDVGAPSATAASTLSAASGLAGASAA